jgi:hypothetical protein
MSPAFVFAFHGIKKTTLARCELSVLFEDCALWFTWHDDVAYTLFM